MFSQITFFIGLVALCHGGLLVDDQGHHTVSSQFTPLVHAGPLVHGSPVLDHSTLLQHGPLVQASPYIQHAAPVAIGHAARLEEEHYAPARYEYSYSVEDPHTGDHKSQHESRDGDVVKGEYSLVQPDGSIRKVEYTADAHSGFNAVVHTSAPNAHAIPGVVPVAHAAPVHSAPLVHAGPVIANFHH